MSSLITLLIMLSVALLVGAATYVTRALYRDKDSTDRWQVDWIDAVVWLGAVIVACVIVIVVTASKPSGPGGDIYRSNRQFAFSSPQAAVPYSTLPPLDTQMATPVADTFAT